MAEGISKTLQDLGNFGTDAIRNILGIRRGFQQSAGNINRYITSQAPVDPNFGPIGSSSSSLSPAMKAAANAQYAEVNRLGGQGALNAAMQRGMSEGPNQFGPNAPASVATPGGPGGIGAPAVNPIEALFAPMFQSLAQREQTANQRYEANREQVTNIYGQITGARAADIATTGEAFRRLSDAASARSTAVNTSIDESEAARLRNNQAALESMGLGALSTSQGDIASQGAAMAKNTNQLNAENWQGLLTAMGVNAQDIARSDVTGFNYRMGEDLGRLRGSREEFLQGLEQERMGLVGQQAQAAFDFQQAQQSAAAAANAAAQRAAIDSADRESKQFAEALKASGPLISTVANLTRIGALSSAEGANVMNVITEWSQNVPSQGNQGWKASTAATSILSAAGENLSEAERKAISAITSNMFPQG
jgi:hypothetical protein